MRADHPIPLEEWLGMRAELLAGAYPWPRWLAVLDLRDLQDEWAAGRSVRLGRRKLADRWRLSEDGARSVVEHEERTRSAPDPLPIGTRSAPIPNEEDGGLSSHRHPIRSQPAPDPHPIASRSAPTRTAARGRISRSAPIPTEEDGGLSSRRPPIGSHDDPSVLTTTSDQEILDLNAVVEGVQGEEDRAALRTFLEVYRRWVSDPSAPKRWRTPHLEAARWFGSEVIAAGLGAGLDLQARIRAWSDWLSGKAENGSGSSGGARFPENWKLALRNWLTNDRSFVRPSERRGAPRGHTPIPTSTPTPGDARADFDALTDD